MKMLAVLEAEARTRRRENADLREHVLQLEEQLESERNTVVQLRREAAQAADGDARLNRDAQAQLVELRAETCSLRQQLAARESAGVAVASAEERVARLERDVQRSQAENGELRQKLADALSLSTGSVGAEESELQLASATTFVKQFLDESHELLASARNACVQLEAAAGRPASKGSESPPQVFDLQTCDVRSLLQIPDVLRYICTILHKAVAASGKFSRTFRYMVC
jgi:predicted RNase H-like nuclease (RuvC/YqgF family)